MASQQQQTTIPTLYNLSSSLSFKVLWALEELVLANNIKYNLKNFPRERGTAPQSFKEVHKLGKAPILLVENADGSLPAPTIQLVPGVVTESKLVLQFVSSEYGNGFFEPESEVDKRRDTFFQEFAMGTLTLKADFTLLFDIIPAQLPIPLSSLVRLLCSPVIAHFKSDLVPIFQLMEDALSEENLWFGGSKLGLSDLNMSFGFDICEQRGWFDGERWPRVKEWGERCKGREGWKAARERGCGYDLKGFT